jgi:hypothetical protein
MQWFSKELIRLAAPLGVVAFWSGMAAAALAYPVGYDWRNEAISALLFPEYDPDGYLWGCAGLLVCGLAGIAWTTGRNQCFDAATAAARVGLRILRAGFMFMCLAVLPDRLLPLPKGHEIFAILAFLGLGIGVMRELLARVYNRESYRRRGTFARFRVPIRASVVFVPLALAGLTLAYLALVRPSLPWISPAWREGISPYLRFGAWEWVNCVVFSVCLLVLWQRRPDS